MWPQRVFISSFTWLICFLLVTHSSGYRLNVPRVLLPYHPTIPVKFVLEVSQPTGGCFNWFLHFILCIFLIISNIIIDLCIFTSASGTMLSCGVSVDQIAKIRVETTTKILFVDAAPARMVVEAFNAEGDTFSTLSEIPIEWELVHSGGNRPLRIAPFEQSTYEAPAEIVVSYVILVEGVVTGSAVLTAKFSEPYLAKIASHSLDLTVVANLLLIPAYDLFVPLYSVVPFKVLIVKQHSTEGQYNCDYIVIVPMPSSSYYLQLDSESVCYMEKETSSVRAVAKGRTNIHLYSQNIDVKAKTGVRPPSTAIHVVDPETLQWTISGSNWLLQTGTRYNLHVTLLDPHGNSMFLSDNLRFETILNLDYFVVHSVSENQTYYEVTPTKIGKTTLKSTFVSVVDKEQQISGKVTGEQTAQIVDPIRIHPSSATGGSGLYDWTVDDPLICNIDSTSGLLSSGSIGTSRVIAVDKRNTIHRDIAQVSVLDILSLGFGETVKEAEVGSLLVLNVQLLGAGSDGAVPFTDCRSIEINVFSADVTIFEHIECFNFISIVFLLSGAQIMKTLLRLVYLIKTRIVVSFFFTFFVFFNTGAIEFITFLIFKYLFSSKIHIVVSILALGQGKPGMVTISAELFPPFGSPNNSSFLKSTIDLRVVYPPSVHPNKLVLWNEKVAHGLVHIRGGSGHYYIVDHPGAPFTATVKENTVTVVPRNEGVGSLRVVDACVENEDELMDITVKITDIHSLIIRGPQFSFYFNILISSLVMEIFLRMDGTRYSIRALSTGVVSLTASARSSSGGFLTSRLHSIQVFSPISLHPKIITLIPESIFQLEIIGGPQPTPPIEFTLNNTKIAIVESTALIRSLNLGYTSITGSVNVGEDHVTKDMVVLRVVSLAGIRIVASSKVVDRGGRLWLRIEGIMDGETPFAFGGALYPFKVTWTVSHPEVLRSIHPLGASVSETDLNHFTAWLDASSAGSAVVKVRVELSEYAKRHFVDSIRVFEDSIEIHVEEPLGLHNPSLPIATVRIAPSTQLQLWTALYILCYKPPSSVEFSVLPEFSGRLSISKSGLLQTFSRHGPAVVVARRIDSADNDTLLIPVVVYFIVFFSLSCSTTELDFLTSVPVPFDCFISFADNKLGPAINLLTVKAVYQASAGLYACEVERQTAGNIRNHISDAVQTDLIVTAKWHNDLQVHEASVQTVFHMAMDVVEPEVHLRNLLFEYYCQISIAHPLFFPFMSLHTLLLNIKSAAMWSELWDRCAVTVENKLTGQKISVPVRVKLVGEAAKHVYNALDSSGFIDFVLIFLQHYSSIIPSLMWACVAGILVIGAYWFLRRRIWEKEGVFTDESTLHSMVSSPSLNRSHLSMQSSPSEFTYIYHIITNKAMIICS
uniref:BIG2 domain-containing protein n=1 Tax=Heterorhabditis bacteriophora TaxID=37862 RepID=A0A1I7WPD1_HETBA